MSLCVSIERTKKWNFSLMLRGLVTSLVNMLEAAVSVIKGKGQDEAEHLITPDQSLWGTTTDMYTKLVN